jgi:hypothetical protein
MRKALMEMNLQLHHVVSDISGATGMRIIRAIVAGERDPDVLASSLAALNESAIAKNERVGVPAPYRADQIGGYP